MNVKHASPKQTAERLIEICRYRTSSAVTVVRDALRPVIASAVRQLCQRLKPHIEKKACDASKAGVLADLDEIEQELWVEVISDFKKSTATTTTELINRARIVCHRFSLKLANRRTLKTEDLCLDEEAGPESPRESPVELLDKARGMVPHLPGDLPEYGMLVLAGLSNKQIAKSMNVSRRTADMRRHQVVNQLRSRGIEG